MYSRLDADLDRFCNRHVLRHQFTTSGKQLPKREKEGNIEEKRDENAARVRTLLVRYTAHRYGRKYLFNSIYDFTTQPYLIGMYCCELLTAHSLAHAQTHTHK